MLIAWTGGHNECVGMGAAWGNRSELLYDVWDRTRGEEGKGSALIRFRQDPKDVPYNYCDGGAHMPGMETTFRCQKLDHHRGWCEQEEDDYLVLWKPLRDDNE